MIKIFYLILGLTYFGVADFTRSNGVVTDSTTQLQWQDDYSSNKKVIKSARWFNAIAYCENLTLNGNSDWRLPNIRELTSLIDDGKYAPAINEVFQNIYAQGYISSTTTFASSYNIWFIGFNKGIQYRNSKAYDSGYIRCVR